MRSAQCYFCAVYAEKSLKVGECCKKAENLADFMTNGGKCEIGAKKGGEQRNLSGVILLILYVWRTVYTSKKTSLN